MIPSGIKRVLDVGCGEGFTSAKLRMLENVEEVVGIELSEEAGRIASKRLDRVLIGDLETMTLEFPSEYFDCIICADILEHLKDPWKILSELCLYLTPDGVMVASIPNIRHIAPLLKIIFNRFEYEESGILDKTHLRFFTLHTIRKLFEETGYEIIRIEKNRDVDWRYRLLQYISLGISKDFSIFQYIVVAKKRIKHIF